MPRENETPATSPSRKETLKRDNGFRYKPRFGILLEYPDETAQERAYELFRAAGHRARVVTV